MSFKVTYFDGGGRADQIRTVLLYTNTSFEDERLPGEEFYKRKMSGEFPFGSVPVLTHGDFKLAQGVACVQYASEITGVWPKDLKESALALSIVLGAEDARQKYYQFYFEKNEETKSLKKKEFETYIATWQKCILKFLEGKKFFFGDKVTGADLAVFTNFVGQIKPSGFAVEKELDEWVERVYASSEAIQKYYKYTK